MVTPPASSSAAPSEPVSGSPPASGEASAEPFDLSPYLTGKLSLLNLAESKLEVLVNYVDTDTGEPSLLATLVLEPLDFNAQKVPPGTYEIEFRDAGSATANAMCRLVLEDFGVFRFVAVDEGVAITRDGYEPTESAELFVSTSSLCGGV